MDLAVEFWQQQAGQVTSWLDSADYQFDVDRSGFTVVDGEEGDFGKIVYSKNGMVVATLEVFGGDQEDLEFTPYGKALMKSYVLEAIAAVFSTKGT